MSGGGDEPTPSTTARGSFTLSGQVPLRLSFSPSFGCHYSFVLGSVFGFPLSPPTAAVSIAGNNTGISFVLTADGATRFPNDANDAVNLYYQPTAAPLPRYVWAANGQGAGRPQGSGIVTVSGEGGSGTINLVLAPNRFFHNNAATGLETIQGHWSCL
jgi:hypothetical protein